MDGQGKPKAPIVHRLGKGTGTRELFYVSPYLSCAECNGVTFINSFTIQEALLSIKNSFQKKRAIRGHDVDYSSSHEDDIAAGRRDWETNGERDDEKSDGERDDEKLDGERDDEKSDGKRDHEKSDGERDDEKSEKSSNTKELDNVTDEDEEDAQYQELLDEWIAEAVAKGKLEVLPKCPQCGRTNRWSIGATDFSAQILLDKKKARERHRLQVHMASRIAAIARGRIQRKRFALDIAAKRAWDAKVFRSVTAIACTYRRKRARRVLQVERALARIKAANPAVVTSIISASRRRRPGPPPLREEELRGKTAQEAAAMQARWEEQRQAAERERAMRLKLFWYKRKEEVALLFRDYQLFVERTGHEPPMYIVEQNILTLGRGIHELETAMATVIQRRIRGAFGRRLSIKFRAEAGFLKRVKCAAVFKIQRVVRGYLARKGTRTRRRLGARARRREATRAHRRRGQLEERVAASRRKLLLHYRKERAEERSARLTGKVAFGAEEGRKMLAFLKSPYGRHRAVQASAGHVLLQERVLREKAERDLELRRKVVELQSICSTLPKFRPYYEKELRVSQQPYLEQVKKYNKYANATQVKDRIKFYAKRNKLRSGVKKERLED